MERSGKMHNRRFALVAILLMYAAELGFESQCAHRVMLPPDVRAL